MYLPIGTTINAAAIVAGGGLGVLLGSHLPERVKDVLYHALGLAIGIMGIKLAIAYQNVFLFFFCLVLGAFTGSLLALQERLAGFADFAQKKLSQGKNMDAQFSNAFVTSTSIVCVGSMAVLGAVEEGTTGNYSIYVVKAFLDGIIAINIASTLGRGVMLSALPLFVYQGILTFMASFLQPWLQGDLLVEFTAVGGVLIAGVGASIIFPDKFKILNLLPAMLWVCILFPIFY